MGRFGGVLGPQEGVWRYFEGILRPFGASWRHLWDVGPLGPLWGRPGPSRGVLEASWVRLWAVLVRSWALTFSGGPPGNSEH